MDDEFYTIDNLIDRLQELRSSVPSGGAAKVIVFDLTDARECPFDVMQGDDEVIFEF